MKRILLTILSLAAFGTTFGQDNMTQFAVDLPQSMHLNPAMRPNRSFLSIPIFGSFQVNAANSFSYSDIITHRDGAKYVNNAALLSITDGDKANLTLGFNLDLINTGFYVSDKDFIGISVRIRTHAATNYPGDLFGFMLNNPLDNMNGYNVNMSPDILGWAEAGISYSRSIGDNFTVGIRGKYIGGLISVQSQNGINFDIEKQADKYILSGDYNIMMGNVDVSSKNIGGQMLSGLGANPGFGVDLGVSFVSNDKKINATASVSDIGMIFWSDKHSSQIKVRNPNQKFAYNGIGDLMSGDIDFGQAMDSVFAGFNKVVGVDTLSGVGFRTNLPLTFQVGATYSIDNYFRHNVSLGMVGSLPYRGGFNYAVSAGYSYRTLNGMWQLMANYTYTNHKPYGLGLGVVFTAGCFQMYLASDDIISFFDYGNARQASARVAFNFFFNRR